MLIKPKRNKLKKSLRRYQRAFACIALAFSLGCAALENQDLRTIDDYDLSPRFEKDSVYIEECGSCHLPYPPMLLPAKSWQKLMQSLNNHFGDDTSLDQQSQKYIANYLQQQAMETKPDSRARHWLNTQANETSIRVTELPGFVEDHDDAYRRMGESSRKTGFFSPCADCHKEAADGIFDKERMFRGVRHIFNRFSGGK
jgi:hypothetical protein